VQHSIKLSHVVKTFAKGITVINGVSLTLHTGKTYALMGASGSGKSTLMHLISGLDAPTSGSVQYGQKEMSTYRPAERAQQVVLVTQFPFLIKELNVLENIELAGHIAGLSATLVKEQALFYLVAVGLFEARHWHVGALSGGQRQRVCMARALLVKPQFLCADEPTGALDEKTGQQIIELLLAHQKQDGMGLLISTHNTAVAEQMEVVFALKDGILVPRQQFLKNEVRHERATP